MPIRLMPITPMQRGPHPSRYELPYHDALELLRGAQRKLAEAKREADSQSDADAAFEWGRVFGELLGEVSGVVERGEALGDPVERHARMSPLCHLGPKTEGTD